MDKRYFKLMEKAAEIAGLCSDLAMNANYRADIDAATRPRLAEYLEAIENLRFMMYLAVSRQGRDDPQERDVDITPIIINKSI